jgi:hypothetical protein
MHQDSGGAETNFVYDLTGQLVKKTFSPSTQYEAIEYLGRTTCLTNPDIASPCQMPKVSRQNITPMGYKGCV